MSVAPLQMPREVHQDHDAEWVGAARSGRDAEFPAWLSEDDATTTRPFDSVVVRGTGVSALACAARLTRSASFPGRVTVAAECPTENPRLINGCTLRARSLDYLAAALGQSPERIIDVLLGDLAPQARSRRQFFSIFRSSKSGYEAVRMGEFMPARAGGDVFAYGLRNSRLVGALAELGESIGLRWTSGKETSLEACRAAALGNSPFVVNGSHLPLAGAPKSTPPSAFVVAWQCTMKRLPTNVLPADGSLIAGVRHPQGMDVGVFYPFADPLTPEADAYGLFYRVVHPTAGYSKEGTIAQMRETAIGVARSIGWEPVGESETAAGAQVPGFEWTDVEAAEPGYFDLHRTFGAGLPIITGCGMARAALAGWLTAECLIRGEAPAPVVNRSLRRWRRLNRNFCRGMEDRTGFAVALLARFPALAVRLMADRPDVWARVAS